MAARDPTGPPPRPDELDPVIHERVRLAICSILAARREVDYLELRATLGVTDGNLAAHAAAVRPPGAPDPIALARNEVRVSTRTRSPSRPSATSSGATSSGPSRRAMSSLSGPAPT